MFSKVVKIDVMFHFCIPHHVGVSLDASIFVLILTHKLTLIAPIFTTIVQLIINDHIFNIIINTPQNRLPHGKY
jgi:hypothetical protein